MAREAAKFVYSFSFYRKDFAEILTWITCFVIGLP